jgi:hypothetical protein
VPVFASKLPGPCVVDVAAVPAEALCAEPRGPFNVCIANLRAALGEGLSRVATSACEQGGAGEGRVLSLAVTGFTRTSEDRPVTGLGTAVASNDARDHRQIFTIYLHVDVRDPAGQSVFSRDIEATEDAGLNLGAIAPKLVEAAFARTVGALADGAALDRQHSLR